MPIGRLNEHLVGRDVVQLSGASFFNVALDARGEVHCWGTPNQEHSFEFARSRKPKLLKGVGDGVTKVVRGAGRGVGSLGEGIPAEIPRARGSLLRSLGKGIPDEIPRGGDP